jgi:tetratricopeptide (TPR) repeat protein
MGSVATIRSGSHNVIVQIIGDGNSVDLSRPHLELLAFRGDVPPTRPLDVLNAFATPLALVGREAELADFTAWLNSPAPVAIRCIIGGAGAGKSRFAIELCRRAEAEGWFAGFVSHAELVRFAAQENLSAWGWARPTLVVVDYAASKATIMKAWVEGLANAHADKKLRLLLLERHAGAEGWWPELMKPSTPGAAQGMKAMYAPQPLDLPGIAEASGRRAILAAVMKAAHPLVEDAKADHPPLPGVDPALDRRIDDPNQMVEPLHLAMAGLLAVQAGIAGLLVAGRTEMALELAGFERGRLERLARDRGLSADRVLHMAALATVAGALGRDDLDDAIAAEAVAEGWPPDGEGLARALLDVLGGPAPGHAHPLQPDLIGEAFVLESLGRKGGPKKQLAALVRWHALRPHAAEESLIRLIQDFGDNSRGQPAIEALAAVIEATADVDALMALANRMPRATVNLRELIARLEERITELLRRAVDAGDEDRLPLLVAALNNLSLSLSALGRREEALARAEEAVDIYCGLAAARPDAFLSDLAMSLANLASRLSALGRREEALARAAEAVDIYRDLAAARPDAFLPDLAGSLNNLANRLSDLERREEALARAVEAVDINRRLAAARPDAFLPNLALSLNNLAKMLSVLGRWKEALARVEEAVDIRRRLAAAHPDAVLPDLAMSLNNLANSLSALGRWEEALARAEEAVNIYRRLAAARPDVFLPDLARSLSVLGDCLEGLGRTAEAVVFDCEAVAALLPFFRRIPQAFAPLMRAIAQEYLRRCEAVGVAPDMELVGEVVAIFEALDSGAG